MKLAAAILAIMHFCALAQAPVDRQALVRDAVEISTTAAQ
jgi:hypothetical protein